MHPDPVYHALTVAEVVDETAGARSFVLDVPAPARAEFAYAAGQFCTFRASLGGVEVVRCYSMSSSPDLDEPLTVTVKRVPGGALSNWMNDALAAGDTIEAMPPAGRFVLRDSDAPLVAFAGGSGITPVFSILKTALATTHRDIALVYANRSCDAVIFADALERLRATAGGRLRVHHHLDDEHGLLDAGACAALAGERTDADFYVCGPGPYMDVVRAALARRAVAPDRIFVESFDVPDEASDSDDKSVTETVTIQLGRRKQTVAYEAGDTILGTARRAGFKPPYQCQAGACATCMAHLDAGRVAMRANSILSEAEVEEGWILTCQAVPLSREVVVDYDA